MSTDVQVFIDQAVAVATSTPGLFGLGIAAWAFLGAWWLES